MNRETRRKARRAKEHPCATVKKRPPKKQAQPPEILFDQVLSLAKVQDDDRGPSLSAELNRLVVEIGADPTQMTLNDLRRAVLKYLSEVIDCDSNDSVAFNSQSH